MNGKVLVYSTCDNKDRSQNKTNGLNRIIQKINKYIYSLRLKIFSIIDNIQYYLIFKYIYSHV